MTDTYEAEYLVLAGRPGMEVLRGECPELHFGREHLWNCFCRGRGWLPLPEAERLGVLMRVAMALDLEIDLIPHGDHKGVALYGGNPDNGWTGNSKPIYRWNLDAETPEAALTKALLAVKEKID